MPFSLKALIGRDRKHIYPHGFVTNQPSGSYPGIEQIIQGIGQVPGSGGTKLGTSPGGEVHPNASGQGPPVRWLPGLPV